MKKINESESHIAGGEMRTPALPSRVTSRLHDLLDDSPPSFRFKEPYLPPRFVRRTLQRVIAFFERYIGPLYIIPRSRILTPEWRRLIGYLCRYGLAERIVLVSPEVREPPLYYFHIWTPYDPQLTDAHEPKYKAFSRGFGLEYHKALSKCFGECLERAPFLFYKNEDFEEASVAELAARGVPFLHTHALDSFTPHQQDLRPELGVPEDESVFRWAKGKEILPDGSITDVLVPAQAFFWKYRRMEGEPLLRECNTHGGAAYFTRDRALVNALCEWVGRDGFFQWWLSGTAPSKIGMNTLPEGEVRQLATLIESYGFTIHLLDVTPADIPLTSVFCVLERANDPEGVAISTGSGADVSLARAAYSALEEALSMHHWILRNRAKVELPHDYDHLLTRMHDQERLNFWAHRTHTALLKPFLKGAEKKWSDVDAAYPMGREVHADSEELAAILASVHGTAPERRRICYVESDHPALKNLGFHAVRVFVEGLIPMYHDARNVPLRIVSKRLGTRGGRLNTLPHPFP